MVYNGQSKLCALFGYPVKHTLSPPMHNAVYEKQGINACYLPFEVKPAELASALRGLKAMGAIGVNLTIPHKYEVLPLLDQIDPLARQIQAVNTIKFLDDKICGYNTDGAGYLKSLLEKYPDFDFKQKKTVIAGAGGSARAIAVALAAQGADLLILNRTLAKAEQLAAYLQEQFAVKAGAGPLTTEITAAGLSEADLFINTTSVGLNDPEHAPVNVDLLQKKGAIVSDIVYTPFKTKLLLDAEKKGLSILEGYGMLLHQGALAHEIWFERPAAIEVMRRLLLQHLR